MPATFRSLAASDNDSGPGKGVEPAIACDARLLRRGLFENGYRELVMTGRHALAVLELPPIHKDPFDRMLLGQSIVEGINLVTADRMLARYSAPLRLV
ncbi:MAG: type II toxin-antitoxin system VapC family toxin [Alphaproteobacteria bacterium]|nr:type II toxin-antitoxin system VapC family toxin [Alphaproteobacteria bacterium]